MMITGIVLVCKDPVDVFCCFRETKREKNQIRTAEDTTIEIHDKPCSVIGIVNTDTSRVVPL